MNYRKTFKQWMKENGYWKTFKGTEGNNYLIRPESFKPENYIISTFSWHVQKEGYQYWLTVHSEWGQYLKSTKEKKMNKSKQIEEIENTIKELKSQVEALKKPVRWRAEVGDWYWYIDGLGNVHTLVEERSEYDTKRWNKGNYFRTKELAEKSIFYTLLNSEYDYWIAGFSELPETTPEGVEEFTNNDWEKSTRGIDNWINFNRRWPKNQGEVK